MKKYFLNYLFSIPTILILFNVRDVFAQEKPSQIKSCDGNVKIPSVIKIVVPTSAGNSSDFAARILAHEIATQFKKMGKDVSLIVENRPGASGNLGAKAVLDAKAVDGSTLLFSQAPELTVNPHITNPVASHTRDSFEPIAFTGSIPYVLICNAEKFKKLDIYKPKQLVEYAKTKPLNYGHGGVTNFTNIAMVQFAQASGIQIENLKMGAYAIPYNGTTPAMNDVMGGHVDCMFQSIPAAVSILKNKPSKIIAMGTTLAADGAANFSEHKIDQLTKSFPQFGEMLNWTGFSGIRGIDKGFVSCFNDHVRLALQNKEIIKKLDKKGFLFPNNSPKTPAEFSQFVSQQELKFKPAVLDLNKSLAQPALPKQQSEVPIRKANQ